MSRLDTNWVRVGTWVLLAMVLLALGVAFLLSRRSDASAPPVVSSIGGFRLVDHDGNAFSAEQLSGRPWVADFIFTRCRSSCPLMTEAMVRLRERWPQQLPVRFVSFSVDPVHDTPEVLRRYRSRYGIEGDDWIFLTGTPPAIQRLAAETFLLPVETDPPPEMRTQEVPILHSSRFVLVDARNRIRGYYDPFEEGAMQRLIGDARRITAAR